MIKKMYRVGVLELFNTKFHGFDEYSSPDVLNRYLVHSEWRRETIEFFFSLLTNGYFAKLNRRIRLNTLDRNPSFIGFRPEVVPILQDQRYLTPDIFKSELLSSGEIVGYPIGTFWLRVFQKKCKLFLDKNRVIAARHTRLPIFLKRELGMVNRSGRLRF